MQFTALGFICHCVQSTKQQFWLRRGVIASIESMKKHSVSGKQQLIPQLGNELHSTDCENAIDTHMVR
eukprot:1155545-Pelagomonas_calceolata.AAC.13